MLNLKGSDIFLKRKYLYFLISCFLFLSVKIVFKVGKIGEILSFFLV